MAAFFQNADFSNRPALKNPAGKNLWEALGGAIFVLNVFEDGYRQLIQKRETFFLVADRKNWLRTHVLKNKFLHNS